MYLQATIEIPYVFLQTLVFVLIAYPMIKFEWTAVKFFYFFFFGFFTLLYFTYTGMMCVAITPNLQLATIVTGLLMTLWNLFSGFLIFRKVNKLKNACIVYSYYVMTYDSKLV